MFASSPVYASNVKGGRGGERGELHNQRVALGHRATLLTSELWAITKVEVRNSLWQVLDIS